MPLTLLECSLGDGIKSHLQVSEHASWSAMYYNEIIQAALVAASAPLDLVQIVTGYAEAGSALVSGGVGKLIFVGSTGVGKKVMAAAAETLTPVVLELGGKDPIIICGDADIDHVRAPDCSRARQNSTGRAAFKLVRFV